MADSCKANLSVLCEAMCDTRNAQPLSWDVSCEALCDTRIAQPLSWNGRKLSFGKGVFTKMSIEFLRKKIAESQEIPQSVENKGELDLIDIQENSQIIETLEIPPLQRFLSQ